MSIAYTSVEIPVLWTPMEVCYRHGDSCAPQDLRYLVLAIRTRDRTVTENATEFSCPSSSQPRLVAR